MEDCDISWGNDEAMIQDFVKRIPLALEDGNLQGKPLTPFLMWLEKSAVYLRSFGATMVYRIDV
jgi:hypothetical protein